MKSIILLTCLCMISFGIMADDLKKEKKKLIETIKTNYNSWQVKQSDSEEDSYSDSSKVPELVAATNPVIYETNLDQEEHIFSDFSFKICETQAVVRFQVDYQMISAFMEKRNGEWQLVCAAVIPLDL